MRDCEKVEMVRGLSMGRYLIDDARLCSKS